MKGSLHHEVARWSASRRPSKQLASNSSAIPSRPPASACIPASDPSDVSARTLAILWRALAITAITLTGAVIAFANVTGLGSIQEYDAYFHFGAFAGITFLAVTAFPQVCLSYMLVGLALLGGVTELLQFTPGLKRQPDLADFGFNILGIDAMLIVIALVRRFLQPPPSLTGVAQAE